jgi:hypothetical protein
MANSISVKKIMLYISLPLTLMASISIYAQKITPADKKNLFAKEDSLSQMARFMILDTVAAGRLLAYKDFVPTFIRALKVKNSFYHPFDSVLGISKLYAPDSSFKIFTWYMMIDDYSGFQRGFIQMKTANGSLKGFFLFDNSDYAENPNELVCKDSTWIGAVYYNIIKNEYKGKKYYTLFGIDRNTARADKKWIDVLSFNEKKEPVFGGPFFSFEEDSLKKPEQSRFSIEFKKEIRTYVNYEPDLEMILVDHLISETDEPESPWTFVPDGDYEGFKWQNGKWVHIDKVFNFKLKDGEFPMDDPIMDLKGKKDEKKIQEKSDSNKKKTDNN